MSEFLRLFATLREQMQAGLSRSDVLRALVWPMSILLTAMIALVAVKAPEWMLVLSAVLFVLFSILYGVSYSFCLLKDRDALRSEKYTLHKLAIEHGMYGDSGIGLLEPPKKPTPLNERGPSPETGSPADE